MFARCSSDRTTPAIQDTSLDLRGASTLTALGAALLACDLIQRLLIAPMARLLPGNRDALLTGWQRFTAHVVIFSLRHMGGVRFGELPDIPATAGVLVLMNHQSLLDIPLVVASMHGVYPRIVTRRRYARGVPLISHMTRLYRYPLVDARATLRGGLKRLGREAARLQAPPRHLPGGNPEQDRSHRPLQDAGARDHSGGTPLERVRGGGGRTVEVDAAQGFLRKPTADADPSRVPGTLRVPCGG